MPGWDANSAWRAMAARPNPRWRRRPACRRSTVWGRSGGGFHSAREYLDLATVTPRLYLLTKLIMAIGADTPHR